MTATETETEIVEDVVDESDYVAPVDAQPEELPVDDATEKSDDEPEPESFPREYVERLRQEAAEARVKAKSADELAQRLHTSLVAADGRLVAPEELPFDAAHLDDPEALNEAISALIEAKPYLAGRTAWGNVGQGARAGDNGGNVDLAGILRARA